MLDQLTASLELIVLQTKLNTDALLVIVSIPWIAFLLTSCKPGLLYLGIIPRKWYGLPGIVCAPLLHANFNHVFFNSIPLIVLSNFILLFGIPYFIHVTIAITVLSGLLIWCFAKPGLHVGASALITGYWAFLVTGILSQETVTSVILGIICLYYFAGIFFGIFPSKRGVSWEGHLFGLLAGLAVRYFIG